MVLFAFVVRLGFGVAAAGGIENFFYPAGAVDQEVMAELGKFPGNGVLIAQLEGDFPDEYKDFVSKVGKAARGAGPDNRVLLVANTWLNGFLAAHARDFAGAPLPALDAVLAAEQTYLASLQDYDPIVCGAVVTGAPLDKPLTAGLEEQAGALVASKFAAIKAGRTDQQLRFAITPKDREPQAPGANPPPRVFVFRIASAMRNPRSCDLKVASLRAPVRACGPSVGGPRHRDHQ